MEGRQTKHYVDVLKAVINIVQIDPEIAVSDFEKAEHKALKIVFPNIKIIGCYFHYSQVIKQIFIYIINLILLIINVIIK